MMSDERACAEALMLASDERLGKESPAALLVCDPFLAHDFWMSFGRAAVPPVASEVWAWGHNDHGQHGLGDKKLRIVPAEVASLHGRRIRAASCGAQHSAVVVDDGELWASGLNTFGQLGFGDTQSCTTFARVEALRGRRVEKIVCGSNHSLAVLESGELFAWGRNRYGQLGLGDTANRTTPEPVAELGGRRVSAVACGARFSVAALESGELFSWGFNESGLLGLGDEAKRVVPTQVVALSGKHIFTVACSSFHAAAVAASGELFTWGWNEYGQLGLDNFDIKFTPQLVEAFKGRTVVSVGCGPQHTLALLESGEVFAFGANHDGQLGLGTFGLFFATPQQVHFFDGKHVRAIHCTNRNSAAELENGELFTWGLNTTHRQLGIDDTKSKPVPTLVATLSGKRVIAAALGFFHGVALVK